MLHASTRKLIDRLAEMTELNKLDWTESESGQIIYSTEGYSVSLTEEPNELVITSNDGKELERATTDELAATQTDEGKTYAQLVGVMTAEAARVARGTEAAISSLLAGMADQIADPEPDAVEETEPEELLAEDPIDDTNVVIAAPMDVPDADAEADALEADDEADGHPEESVEVEADDTIAALSTSDEPIVSDAETESDVTEAVARLADEVNQREESGLDAAAATAVGAVALAAGLASEEEASEEEASQEEASEPTEPTLTEESTFASVEEPVVDAEPAKYAPFGLDAAAADKPEEIAQIEPEATAVLEDTVSLMEAAPETDLADVEPVADEPLVSETEESSAVAAEPVLSETVQADTMETVVPFAAVSSSFESETSPAESLETESLETAASVEDNPMTETEGEAPEETVEAPMFGIAAAAAEPMMPVTDEASMPAESMVEEIARPADTAFVETLDSPTVETAPAESIAVETPVPITQQSYSLSGIGAGFGLGALSAKTEASGVPGPNVTAEPEKVVIDATEDVLPEIDGRPALPEGLPVAAETGSGNEDGATEASSDEEEGDILKPRTRFNPWD
jgi:PBP1b-binding outer membrane lipoprotein LpoB